MAHFSSIVFSSRYRSSLNVTATGTLTTIRGNTLQMRNAVGNVKRHTKGATLRRITITLRVHGGCCRGRVNVMLGRAGHADSLIDHLSNVPIPHGGTIVNNGTCTRRSKVRRSNILGGPRACRVVAPRLINIRRGSLPLNGLSNHRTFISQVTRVNCRVDSPTRVGVLFTHFGRLTSGGGGIARRSVRTLVINGSVRSRSTCRLGQLRIRFIGSNVRTTVINVRSGNGGRTGVRSSTAKSKDVRTVCGAVGHVVRRRVVLGRCGVRTVANKGSTRTRIRIIIRSRSNGDCGKANVSFSILATSTGTCVRTDKGTGGGRAVRGMSTRF